MARPVLPGRRLVGTRPRRRSTPVRALAVLTTRTLDGLALVNELEVQLGVGVAIVDLNDYGSSIRAASASSPMPFDLQVLLRDNPLGQRAASTPVGLLRPLTTPGAADQDEERRRRRVSKRRVSFKRWSSGAPNSFSTPR